MKRLSAGFVVGFVALWATSAAHAERHIIQVASGGFTFTPASLNALAGDQIVWTWVPGLPVNHTVTEDTGLFDSGLHMFPYRFRRIINIPGDYFYHCTLHGMPGGIGMAGVLHISSRDHDDEEEAHLYETERPGIKR